MTALADRVSTPVERADFDDLVTLVSQAPPWEKDRSAGVRILLRAIGEGKANAPEQILARWTWRLARATRKVQDRRASAEFPEAKRLLGAVANSRGHRHEENVAQLVQVARALPARRRRRTARLGRRLHAAGERAARPGARGARRDPRDRERAGGEPARPRRRRRASRAAGARSARPGAARRRRRGRRRWSRSRRTGQAPRRPEPVARGAGGERGLRRRSTRRSRTTPSGARRQPPPTAPSRSSSRSRGRAGTRVSSAASDSPVGRSASSTNSLDRVGPPLELCDVLGRLRIGGNRLADLLARRPPPPPRARPASIVVAEQLAEPDAERLRRARARRERDVVGHRRPQAHRRDPRRRQASWSTPTMPVGPSYRDGCRPELLDERRVAGRARSPAPGACAGRRRAARRASRRARRRARGRGRRRGR